MKLYRIYLDNCCFNRPYDGQTYLLVRLETEAFDYTLWQENLFEEMSIGEISRKAAEYRNNNRDTAI